MSEAQLTRKAIRLDAVARLKAAATPAGLRVYGPRTTRIPDDHLPALLVYTQTGDGRNISGNAPTLRWAQALVVECLTTASDDDAMGADLDDLADAVEDALLSDPEWVAQFEKVPSVRYAMTFDGEGRARLGAAQLTFSVEFCREYPPKVDTLADLSTVQLAVDTLPIGGADTATATIPL